MSRNTQPFTIPADVQATVDEIVAANRLRFGRGEHFMTTTPPEPTPPTPPAPPAPTPGAPAAPERPEGVTEDEWKALGDPGRAAIVRERGARTTAERALAASRARPTPPKPPGPGDKPEPPTPAADPNNLEEVVQKAVAAAVKPFQDREEQREAAEAVRRIQVSVADAAKEIFHDTSDAIAGVDLTKVTDGNGNADPAKIKTELDELLKAKPHLGKVPDGRLYAQPGFGPAPSSVPLETRVQNILGEMQASAGIKPPPATS